MQKGQKIRVIRAGKQAPWGSVGTIFWVGQGKFGLTRLGFKDSNGHTCWANVDDCAVIDEPVSEPDPTPEQIAEGIASFKSIPEPGPSREINLYRLTEVQTPGAARWALGAWWPKSETKVCGDWLVASEWIILKKLGHVSDLWMTHEQFLAIEGGSTEVSAPQVEDIGLPEVEIAASNTVEDILCGLFAD